jgi:HSP20 family protein
MSVPPGTAGIATATGRGAETFGNLGRSPGRQLEGVTEWALAVDATTKDGNLVIRAELPGVKPEDVDISLHGNVLTISGERKAEQEEEPKRIQIEGSDS